MRLRGVYAIVTAFLLVFMVANFVGQASAKTRVEANIFYPGSNSNTSSLNSFQSELGIKFTAAMWYQNWSDGFGSNTANNYHSNGYIPELTWEPQLADGTGIAYGDVTSGNYDGYLNTYAKSVAALGFPVRISLAPEMNTDWTPWGIGSQGNSATNFKAFWQHVVNLFRNDGATNVSWIWSPNVRPYNASTLYGNYANLYPGDGYVDYMGLDGYNWGTSQSWSTWQSFNDVFQSSYKELLGVSGKSIIIMEIASTEVGGDKAAWITDMFYQLQNNYPHIKGFTWFDINKETDWRINSSAAAEQSFINGYNTGGVTSIGSSPSTTSQPINKQSSTTSSVKPNTASTAKAAQPTTGSAKRLAPPDTNTQTSLPNKSAGTIVSSIQDTSAGFTASRLLPITLWLLLSFMVIGYLTHRRYRIVSYHHKNATIATWYHRSLVDSIFHPRLIAHFPKKKKPTLFR